MACTFEPDDIVISSQCNSGTVISCYRCNSRFSCCIPFATNFVSDDSLTCCVSGVCVCVYVCVCVCVCACMICNTHMSICLIVQHITLVVLLGEAIEK